MMWAGDPACATVTQADAQLTRRCGIICIGPGVAVLSPLPGHPAYRPLARLLKLPDKEVDAIFGDGITTTGHRVMAAV